MWQSYSRDKICFFLIIFLWIISIIIVNPNGEFPLNDDWSYTKVVKNFIESGKLAISGWISMPLVGQVVWGALFCLPTGFSFLNLRISTLILGLIGWIFAFKIVNEIYSNKKIAFLTSLTIAFNPLYFNNSFTFMTDVPFTSIFIVSIYFFIKGFNAKKTKYFYLGSIFSAWASLIRQFGVLGPIVFSFVILFSGGFKKKPIKLVLNNLLLSVGPFLFFHLWLYLSSGFPVKYDVIKFRISKFLDQGLKEYLEYVWLNSSAGLIYLGFFIFPIILLLSYKRLNIKNVSFFFGGFIFLAISLRLIWNDQCIPNYGNVLSDIGLGPLLLRDTYILGLPHWPKAPSYIWNVINFLGLLGGGVILLMIYKYVREVILQMKRKQEFDKVSLFLFWITILNLCLIFFVGYYDRYLIMFPILLLAWGIRFFSIDSIKWVSVTRLSALFMIIFFMIFSIGATHDYLSWNRARWCALRSLIEDEQVSPREIDGGFEFNGWFLYDSGYIEKPGKSYWWVIDDFYIISFGPLIGYKIKNKFPFSRWIPPRKGFILVLERDEEQQN